MHNGRRYHSSTKLTYFLPNDESEGERLDLQHYMFKTNFNGHLARIPLTPRVRNVLDIGTGTGIWAIEFAETHPEMQVFATDISPIQPTAKPANCRFLTANAEEPWNFDRKFDYIHARLLTFGMHDWSKFFEQCWDNLSPGGWLETLDYKLPALHADGEVHPETPYGRYGQLQIEALAKAGIDTAASERFGSILEAQGFVNIDRVDSKWPIGAWAKGEKEKAIGRANRQNGRMAIPGLGDMLLGKVLGWDKPDVDALVQDVLKELDESHIYLVV